MGDSHIEEQKWRHHRAANGYRRTGNRVAPVARERIGRYVVWRDVGLVISIATYTGSGIIGGWRISGPLIHLTISEGGVRLEFGRFLSFFRMPRRGWSWNEIEEVVVLGSFNLWLTGRAVKFVPGPGVVPNESVIFAPGRSQRRRLLDDIRRFGPREIIRGDPPARASGQG